MYDTGLPAHGIENFHVDQVNSRPFRIFFKKSQSFISPWHEIPIVAGDSLMGDKLLNMVVEIPKGTRAKLEMIKEEQYNPIGHDLNKDGSLRYINYSPVLYNYGFLPQTWENPHQTHPEIGLKGDGDPLDVIDIGFKRIEAGSVVKIKILGCLALIDQGQIDWKVLGISLDDPSATKINSVQDISKTKPGITNALLNWYKYYKTHDGKPQNEFAYDEKIQDSIFTFKMIGECYSQWKSIGDDQKLTTKYHFTDPYNRQ